MFKLNIKKLKKLWKKIFNAKVLVFKIIYIFIKTNKSK